MRLFSVIFGFFSFVITALAQDLIVTQDGKTIMAYRVDVSNTSVYYAEESNENALIKSMPKKNILVIKFHDGRTQVFDSNNDGNASIESPVQEQETNIPDFVFGLPDDKRNQELINKYTKIDLSPAEPYRTKKSYYSFLHFAPTPKSILSNADLEIEYTCVDPKTSYSVFTSALADGSARSAVLLTIHNKTDKVVHLDLGNSFFKIAGKAIPYYVPGAVSSSSGNAVGTSINLGGVANAVGIGGAAGALANAVNVGVGGTNSSTNIVYNQRIVSIPPRSSINLKMQEFFPDKKADYWGDMVAKTSYAFGNFALLLSKQYIVADFKSEKSYFYENTPMKWGTYITYGFDENMKSCVNIEAEFFLKAIYGFYINLFSWRFEPASLKPYMDAFIPPIFGTT